MVTQIERLKVAILAIELVNYSHSYEYNVGNFILQPKFENLLVDTGISS